jgi:hypothetical protein
MGMPHTRALGNGLFELRMKSKESIGHHVSRRETT